MQYNVPITSPTNGKERYCRRLCPNNLEKKNIRKEYVPIFSPGKARRDIANIVINPWQRATGVSRDAFLNNLSPPARWGEREFKRKKPKPLSLSQDGGSGNIKERSQKPFHFHFHKMGEAGI